MAFGVGPHDSVEEEAMADINVTPLVDVMLVLLIIFMVTAPLLTVGVDIDAKASLPDVNLPRTEAGQVAPERAPLSITIEADGTLYLQNAQISFEDLAPKLAAIRDAGGTAQVWVRGDTQSAYGDVARVLVRVKEAGLPVTLLTDQVAPR